MHVLSWIWTCGGVQLSPASRWYQNECDGVSYHQRLDGLLNRLFSRRSKKTSKLRVTGLCEGNSSLAMPFCPEFPYLLRNLPYICTALCKCSFSKRWRIYQIEFLKCYYWCETEIWKHSYLRNISQETVNITFTTQIARFMGPTWGPPGSCRPQMGPMSAPWTLLSGT